jgi:hypothetical protein
MPGPDVLLELALTIHPEHPEDRQDHAARLAARLGYTEVWLPAGEEHGRPIPERLELLAAAAEPARLGLVVDGDPDDVAAWLGRSPYAAGHVLLELPASTEALRRAVGGPEGWRHRVRLPSFDPDAAGTVVRRPTREAIIAGVLDAMRSRTAAAIAPARHPVVAALPVSIGRTVSEAMARAVRDPRFAGDRHPREAGLFGTYEDAQGQALELAAAGADGLQVTVADEIDVADLLAQVRSLVVGATPVLHSRRI